MATILLSDESDYLEQVALHKPRALIFDDASFSHMPARNLTPLLGAEPEMCIVVFNSQDNHVTVYRKQQLPVNESIDCITYILNTLSRLEHG